MKNKIGYRQKQAVILKRPVTHLGLGYLEIRF